MLRIYSSLLEQGWTMRDIDEMDIFYYFKIIAFKLKENGKEQKVYIDQIL